MRSLLENFQKAWGELPTETRNLINMRLVLACPEVNMCHDNRSNWDRMDEVVATYRQENFELKKQMAEMVRKYASMQVDAVG